MKKIKTLEDLDIWYDSPGFKKLQIFLQNLSRSVTSLKLSELPEMKCCTTDESNLFYRLEGYLIDVERIVDEIEVFKIENGNGQGQRYGNKAFRILIERIKIYLNTDNESEKYSNLKYLHTLFINSFGDPTRIDYGTGHELNFLIFVMCSLLSNRIEISNSYGRVSKEFYAKIAGDLIGCRYIGLVRKIQSKYSLEPAGSHGVWGLDDHQFVPFLLGSAQLIRQEDKMEKLAPEELIKVSNFGDEGVRREYFYPAALYHIHQLKTKSNPSLQFFHHSPLLYDISGIPTWQRIHDGLFRMYTKEVLSKFPVVQHILFDEELFIFKKL